MKRRTILLSALGSLFSGSAFAQDLTLGFGGLQKEAEKHSLSDVAVSDDAKENHLDRSGNPLESFSGPVGDFSKQGAYGLPNAPFRIQISGNRIIPLWIAVPESHISHPMPFIVMSHSFNQSPESMWPLAAHFASHGFFVIIPEISSGDTTQRVKDLHDALRSIPYIQSRTSYNLIPNAFALFAVRDAIAPTMLVSGAISQKGVTKQWPASCLVAINPESTDDVIPLLATYDTPTIFAVSPNIDKSIIQSLSKGPREGLRILVAVKNISDSIMTADGTSDIIAYWKSFVTCAISGYVENKADFLDIISGKTYTSVTHHDLQIIMA